MCFSAKASMISFTIGIIGSLICISLGSISDKIIGYFLGFVSLMQGIEYLLWKHPICDQYNKNVSIMGMILNHLQPFMLGIIILFLNKNIKHKKWILLIMCIYLLFIIPYSIQFLAKNNKMNQCTIKNNENHLLWNWNLMNYNSFVYFIFLFTMCSLFILGFPTLKYGIFSSLIAIITYTSSAIFYSNNILGTIWCYYVAFIPILYCLIKIIL